MSGNNPDRSNCHAHSLDLSQFSILSRFSISLRHNAVAQFGVSDRVSVADTQLRFFLLGATGRTGLPFVLQALARGHFVTIFVRNASKLPATVASHSRLRVFTGEMHETDKVARAMREANPDVVYVMLASETAPYTAVSTGTHSALLALRELKAVASAASRAIPFISIAAWGLGPTESYINGFFARVFVGFAKTFLWSRPLNDFKKQFAELEEAKGMGLIRPTLILPPMLNNAEKTNTYLSGEASAMKDAMGVMNFVSRASMADLCLKLGEKVAAGEELPQWVGITNG
jgi:putative NADH-flavin reductase